jgi:hypothetical protein
LLTELNAELIAPRGQETKDELTVATMAGDTVKSSHIFSMGDLDDD